MHKSLSTRPFLLFITFVVLLSSSLLAENWARFRGPQGAGISNQKGIPTTWSNKDYFWTIDLPGIGHSSPCVWGDHVFLTSATDKGRKRMILAVDAKSGKILWSRSLDFATNAKHRLNSYASATPASDGEHVYSLFASHEEVVITAHDFKGKLVWKRGLGAFIQKIGQVHGNGTSPIVYDGKVIVANQQDGESSIIALDSKTGKAVWQNPRSLRLTAHSTPIVLQRKGKPARLFINNTGDGIAALDPSDGKLLFHGDLMPARCVGSPVVAKGLVFATCGGGGSGKFLAGIPVDATGVVDKSKARWTSTKKLPYVPTPVAFGDHLFLWGDKGIVVCVNAETGKEVWTERVGGQYWSSPICVSGKIYCVADDGTVVVIAAANKYQLLGKTELGDPSHSTPAVAGGRMFIRSFHKLFCLKATK